MAHVVHRRAIVPDRMAMRRGTPAERRNGADTVLGILHLPEPPDPVEHAVMEVEGGVAGRAVEILRPKGQFLSREHGGGEKGGGGLTPPGSPPWM